MVPYCLVNETTIQAETSPVTGARPDPTVDQSVFRLLLTGQDDSAIAEKLTPPQFKVSKAAKIQTVDELIEDLDVRLATARAETPAETDPASLEVQMEALRNAIDAAEESVQAHINGKSDAADRIFALEQRSRDIALHLDRFERLDQV